MTVKQNPYILPMLYLRIQHTLTTRARNRDDTIMDCKELPQPSFHGDTRDLVNRFIRKPREIGLGFRNRSSHCHNQVESNDYLSGSLGGHGGRSEDHVPPKHRRAGRELIQPAETRRPERLDTGQRSWYTFQGRSGRGTGRQEGQA